MKKTLYTILPLVLIASGLNAGDTASVEQTPQQEGAVSAMQSSEQRPYSQGYQDQRSLLEQFGDWLKGKNQEQSTEQRPYSQGYKDQRSTLEQFGDWLKGKNQEQSTEGATLGERASAAAQRAKVRAKDATESARQSLTGERDLGPTVGERASAVGQTLKVKAEDWKEKLKEMMSTQKTTQPSRGYQERTSRTFDSPSERAERSQTASKEGKDWSQTWEDIKAGIADTFGTKKARAEEQA